MFPNLGLSGFVISVEDDSKTSNNIFLEQEVALCSSNQVIRKYEISG